MVNSPPEEIVLSSTCRDSAALTIVHSDATKEIIMMGHVKRVNRKFRELEALDIVDDGNEGHAHFKILPTVAEIKIIDPQHVGELTVDRGVGQQNSLGSVTTTVSIVPSEILSKPDLTE